MVPHTEVLQFLQATEAQVAPLAERVALWRTLRKRDALESVAGGSAKLYFTPAGVNLSIEDHEHTS